MATTLEAVPDQPPLEEDPDRRARALSLWPLGVAAAAAGATSLIARAVFFPLFSGNSDESVYIYQARMLAQGHVTLSARVHEEFFYPWLFGQRGTRLFPRYQPAWPTVIAVSHALGSEKIALVTAAIAVTVAVWFLAQEFERGSAIYAVGVFLLSPIFIIQSATYLPYLWITALVTGALAAALAGLRTRRHEIYAVCGALLGVAQLTRPADALLFAIPIVVYLTGRLVADDAIELRKALLWVALGVLPFVAITVAYNVHITGAPLRFPQQVAEPLDTFGFGPRRFAPDFGTLDYDRAKAVRALQQNSAAIPRWLAGGGIGLVLALATVVLRRRRATTWLLFVVALDVSRRLLLLVGNGPGGRWCAQRPRSPLLRAGVCAACRARGLEPAPSCTPITLPGRARVPRAPGGDRVRVTADPRERELHRRARPTTQARNHVGRAAQRRARQSRRSAGIHPEGLPVPRR